MLGKISRCITTLTMIFFLVGCFGGDQRELVITSFSTNPITLESQGYGSVVGLQLDIEGNISNPIVLKISNGDTTFSSIPLSPNTNYSGSHDWYTDSAQIYFEGGDGVTGELTLNYSFSSL